MEDLINDLEKIGPSGVAYVIFRLMEEDSVYWTPFLSESIQLFDVKFGLTMMSEYAILLGQKYCNWIH